MKDFLGFNKQKQIYKFEMSLFFLNMVFLQIKTVDFIGSL